MDAPKTKEEQNIIIRAKILEAVDEILAEDYALNSMMFGVTSNDGKVIVVGSGNSLSVLDMIDALQLDVAVSALTTALQCDDEPVADEAVDRINSIVAHERVPAEVIRTRMQRVRDADPDGRLIESEDCDNPDCPVHGTGDDATPSSRKPMEGLKQTLH